MPDRDEKFEGWQRHKTPRDVARYMRSGGAGIGRNYETHGNVWDVDNDILQTGLLHLILDELEKVSKQLDQEDPMDEHRRWLNNYRQDVIKLNNQHKQERDRLFKMFGPNVFLGSDVRNNFDMHRSSRLYRMNSVRHSREYNDLVAKIKRMKSVKKPKDAINLCGVGKKSVAILLGKLPAKSS